MLEQQNIKYKSSWYDNYLKWICGFTTRKADGLISAKTIVGHRLINIIES
jgi:ATP-dependent DNA helicase RecG